MSQLHPVIAVTGSSGAGTSTVMKSFAHIFRREGIQAQVIEGDSFHRYDRVEMRARVKAADSGEGPQISHFGPESNLLAELDRLAEEATRRGRPPRCPNTRRTARATLSASTTFGPFSAGVTAPGGSGSMAYADMTWVPPCAAVVMPDTNRGAISTAVGGAGLAKREAGGVIRRR